MVAEHLERAGRSPAGVVLLDTYDLRVIDPQVLSALQRRSLELMGKYGASDASLTASMWYMVDSGFLQGERPNPLSAPTLHVRASESMTGIEEKEWRSRWSWPHTAVDGPGDHFTMMQSPLTGRIVDEWMSSESEESWQ
jgi:hypothetical protein